MTVRLHPDLAILRRLADVARGAAEADLTVSGGALVNVFTEELQEDWGLAVAAGRVAFVGPDSDVLDRAGAGTERLDLEGGLVAPGLIEGHTHLTRVRVSDMADAQVACGVTTSIVELQEASFLVGPAGAREFLSEAEQVAGRIFYTVSGMISIDSDQDARLRAEDWIPLLDHPRCAGLGEIYWPWLLRRHQRTESLIAAALERGLAVEGHGAGARLPQVEALAAFGVGSDHEGVDATDLLNRLRSGLIALARQGATRQDIAALANLADTGVDLSRMGAVTDGVEPEPLVRGQSLNRVVDAIVALGLPLPTAVRMATRTIAEHFGLGRWLGGLGPGMLADFAVVPRVGGFRPSTVRVGGHEPRPSPPSRYPAWMLDTCRLRGLSPGLLTRPPRGRYRAMEIQAASPLVTREVESDGQSDLICTVVDRAGGERSFRGLLRGFGLRGGAIAISSAWECPGALLVGDEPSDLAVAAQRLQDLRGGAVVVSREEVLAEFAAPVAGLYSQAPMAEVAQQVGAFNRAVTALGATVPNPLLSLEVLCTGAIPFLRIWAGGYRRLRDGSAVGLDW
ncbi:MAG: amidohydrolase family protein [Candidatus Dormibacteraeota bacterium]|nr:amidohydrolase family protein [Candidatus Dormibacteraeota bacterium]